MPRPAKAFLPRPLAEMRIPDIAAHHLQVVARRDLLQPSPAVEGVVRAQGPDVAAHGQRHFREMRAIKPSAPVTSIRLSVTFISGVQVPRDKGRQGRGPRAEEFLLTARFLSAFPIAYRPWPIAPSWISFTHPGHPDSNQGAKKCLESRAEG